MTQVADAFVRYLADTKDLAKAIGPGGPVDQAADSTAKTVGSRFSGAFTKTATAAGAAGGVFFATALEGATKFEDQLRTINTVARLPDADLAKIGDQIQQVSRDTGKSTDDLTAAFYDLVSAGVPAEKAIGVLSDSAKLAVGALGTTGEAVDAVTSALNAYDMGADQSTKVTDVLAQAVQDGKVTISEIGSSIANIAPVAAAAGVSLEEVSAGYAALTAKGVPAAQAATQMRAAISALLTPNKQLNDISAQTGINFAELARDKGLGVALEALRQATTKNVEAFAPFEKMAGTDLPGALKKYGDGLGLTEAGAKKFQDQVGKVGLQKALADLRAELGVGDEGFAKALGSIEAYQFGLQSTGENAASFQAQIVKTMGAAGIANDQYAEKSKSAMEQGKRAVATVLTFAQDVGGPFVKEMGGGIFALNELGRAFGVPLPIGKLLGGVLGGIAGRAIPLLITGIAGILPAVSGALAALAGGMGAVFSVALAAWPLLLLAAVIAAIVFLVNNPEIVAQIGEFVGSVLNAIGSFLAGLGQFLLNLFSAAFQMVVDAAPGFIIALAQLILSLPFRILELQVRLLEFFAGIATNILGGIAQLVANIVGFFVALPGRIASIIPAIAGLFSTLVGNIVGFFVALPGRIVSVGGAIVRAIIGGLSSLPGKLAGAIGDAFRSINFSVGPFHISGTNGISIDLPDIKLPGFAVGSLGLPEDMIAMVHKGEIIVPAKESEAIRSGRATLGMMGAGGAQAPGGPTNTINVYNPTPEPASTSVQREMRKLAYMGSVS